MRKVSTPPFDYGGFVFSAYLYYPKHQDLVEFWELVYDGYNLSQMTWEQVQKLGISQADIDAMNRRVRIYVNALEGRWDDLA